MILSTLSGDVDRASKGELAVELMVVVPIFENAENRLWGVKCD